MSFEYDLYVEETHSFWEVMENCIIEESLDEIAMRGTTKIIVTKDFPGISPGQRARIVGKAFQKETKVSLIHPAVVWECDSQNNGIKHLDVTIYDATIYLAKSEDEYWFPAGQTADQRLRKYAADWGIPLSNVPNTGIKLDKAIYRSQTIYSMIRNDLVETVKKGGKMYRPRMTPQGLELFEIGSNKEVWELEANLNIDQLRTLEGVITQVKVLGSADDEKKSPVLAVVTGETGKFGTLQKVLRDDKIKNPGQATAAAKPLLSKTFTETFSVTSIDVNTIRAGDKTILNGIELIVTSVRHELGTPGQMILQLASMDQVKRRYFYDESL